MIPSTATHTNPPLTVDARGIRIGIAVSVYHDEITSSMREAAVKRFLDAGGLQGNLVIVTAPGTFELTALCRSMAELHSRTGHTLDAAIALGCVISGQTTHDQYLASAVSHGLTQITVATGMPIAFGVLTCQSIEQALARSINAHAEGGINKGAEAMNAAIATVNAIGSLRSMRGWR